MTAFGHHVLNVSEHVEIRIGRLYLKIEFGGRLHVGQRIRDDVIAHLAHQHLDRRPVGDRQNPRGNICATSSLSCRHSVVRPPTRSRTATNSSIAPSRTQVLTISQMSDDDDEDRAGSKSGPKLLAQLPEHEVSALGIRQYVHMEQRLFQARLFPDAQPARVTNGSCGLPERLRAHL